MFEWALDTSKRYLDNWTENAILKKIQINQCMIIGKLV